jgi:hypothetical protein
MGARSVLLQTFADVGPSTRAEIDYALRRDKKVTYERQDGQGE